MNLDDYSDNPCLPDPSTVDLELLLPTAADEKAIRGNMPVLMARTLKKHVPFFRNFAKGVERHITHEFYEEMSQKSAVVSVLLHVHALVNYGCCLCYAGPPRCYPQKRAKT